MADAETNNTETNQADQNQTATPPTPPTTPAPSGGGWAGMSAENKKRVYVAGGVLLIVIFAIWRIAGHKSTNTPPPNAAVNPVQTVDIPALEQAVVKEPTADHYVNLSYGYYMKQRYMESISSAQAAIKLRPDYALAMNNIAACYESMNDWDAAIEWSEKVLKIKPDLKLTKEIIAHCIAEKKKQADRQAELEASLAKEPNPDGYLKLSDILYKQHNYAECIATTKKAIKMKPDYAEAYNNMAAAYQMLKDWDHAIQYGTKALELNPAMTTAKRIVDYSTAKKKLGTTGDLE